MCTNCGWGVVVVCLAGTTLAQEDPKGQLQVAAVESKNRVISHNPLRLPQSSETALEAYAETIEEDLRTMRRQRVLLGKVMRFIRENRELIARASQPQQVLSPFERKALVGLWQQFYLAFSDLDRLAQAYHLQAAKAAAHQPIDYSQGRMLGVSARAIRLVYGHQLLQQLSATGGLGHIAPLLDEAHAGRALERGTFAAFKSSLFDVPQRLELIHYAKYEVDQDLSGQLADNRDGWLGDFWRDHRGELITLLLAKRDTTGFGESQWGRSVQATVKGVQHTLVKPVAQFLGGTKVASRNSQLISDSQIEVMLEELEPGDFFLEKTTWVLSNLFITGFWGHTGIYVGSYSEATAYFDEPQVTLHFRKNGYRDFADFMDSTYPQAVAAWRQADAQGHPMRILEGDGINSTSVFWNTAEKAFAADYVAVLRPHKLSKLDKALSLVDAFSYWKAEYDFDFDVRSDSALVCTELLAKAYAPDQRKRGVEFYVDKNPAGRFVVYPNKIAEQYVAERNSGNRQLDFVYFLKGVASKNRAVVANELDFVASYQWSEML